ncbi:AT-rich interactive domain-containing protein 1A, partial [Aplysia californica]|uniref:AT-rich interactive domain-containing protein 1A n=1 Tax=Aplysia californica TaxID=6500 RepID=A0ABM1AFL0_APLCA
MAQRAAFPPSPNTSFRTGDLDPRHQAAYSRGSYAGDPSYGAGGGASVGVDPRDQRRQDPYYNEGAGVGVGGGGGSFRNGRGSSPTGPPAASSSAGYPVQPRGGVRGSWSQGQIRDSHASAREELPPGSRRSLQVRGEVQQRRGEGRSFHHSQPSLLHPSGGGIGGGGTSGRPNYLQSSGGSENIPGQRPESRSDQDYVQLTQQQGRGGDGRDATRPGSRWSLQQAPPTHDSSSSEQALPSYHEVIQHDYQQEREMYDGRGDPDTSLQHMDFHPQQQYPYQQEQDYRQLQLQPQQQQQQQQQHHHHSQQQLQQQQQQPGSRGGSMRNLPSTYSQQQQESPSSHAHPRGPEPRPLSSRQPDPRRLSAPPGGSFGPGQRSEVTRGSGRMSRDVPDSQEAGRRYGSTRSLQVGVASRDSRPGSLRGQGGVSGKRRSTGSSIYGFLIEGRGVNVREISDVLQQGFVLLTGGRDTQGGPVVTLPSLQARPDPEMDQLTVCLQYLIQIPSEETKRKGFSVVLDTRQGSWAGLGSLIGCLQHTMGNYLKQILVVLHEHDRRAQQDRPSNSEPKFVTVDQLQRYVDPKQLTYDLGGQMQYDHDSWLRIQLRYESFLQDSQAVVEHLDRQESEIQRSYGGPGGQEGHGGQLTDEPASPIEALRKHRHFQDAIMTV